GALSGDPMLQMPMICDCSCAWNMPEAVEVDPEHGEAELRGIYWETLTAYAAAVAGADMVIMRHPKSVKLFRDAIADISGGV
ncbi:MAG TPA: acetyl-CoA decarbonylase/synthase complex subunit delta, partial [Thermoplasmata archaeon]|nr:acetyl-CoA decarbonylase/synthase complex subunit delta [Thermoplasmata archaeon]